MNTFTAVVQKIVSEGGHGSYAVAILKPLVPTIEGSVTFSLQPPAWQEKDYPSQGQVVVLSNLKQKRAGWRAETARYTTPADEQAVLVERSRQMVTKQTLSSMVEEFAGQTKEEPTDVEFAWDGIPEVKRVNVALRNMDDEKRIQFLSNMLKLWNGAFYNASDRAAKMVELRKIFGGSMDDTIGLSLIYTVTGNGKQFRCWYGKPGAIGHEHCDSCGEGLLFGVYGTRASVNKYIDALLNDVQRQFAITLPNDGIIYGFSWKFC
jgi:hypothetical protein